MRNFEKIQILIYQVVKVAFCWALGWVHYNHLQCRWHQHKWQWQRSCRPHRVGHLQEQWICSAMLEFENSDAECWCLLLLTSRSSCHLWPLKLMNSQNSMKYWLTVICPHLKTPEQTQTALSNGILEMRYTDSEWWISVGMYTKHAQIWNHANFTVDHAYFWLECPTLLYHW